MRNCFTIFQFSLALLVAVSQSAFAERYSSSFEKIKALALEASPLIKDLRKANAAAIGEGLKLATLENPSLDAEIKSPQREKELGIAKEISISISQPIRASDFGTRGRINTLIRELADNDQRLELLEFSQRLRIGYIKTWALEERLKQFDAMMQLNQQLVDGIEHQSNNGYIPLSESKLFKAETLKMKHQRSALKSDATRSRTELATHAGIEINGELAPVPQGKIPVLDDLIGLEASLPTAERAKLALSLARQQLELSRLDAFPRFAPRVVYERSSDSTDFIGVGLSFELPLFNRNHGAQLASEAHVAAAESSAESYTNQPFQRQITAVSIGIHATEQLVRGYEQEIIPTLNEALSAEHRLLKSGQGSLLRIWQVQRELSDAQSELMELRIKAAHDHSELVALTGVDF